MTSAEVPRYRTTTDAASGGTFVLGAHLGIIIQPDGRAMMHIFIWIVPLSFLLLVLWIKVRKEAASVWRDESVIDRLFRSLSNRSARRQSGERHGSSIRNVPVYNRRGPGAYEVGIVPICLI